MLAGAGAGAGVPYGGERVLVKESHVEADGAPPRAYMAPLSAPPPVAAVAWCAGVAVAGAALGAGAATGRDPVPPLGSRLPRPVCAPGPC